MLAASSMMDRVNKEAPIVNRVRVVASEQGASDIQLQWWTPVVSRLHAAFNSALWN